MKRLNVFILLTISLLVVACSDQKNEPTIDDSSATVTLPTVDLLTETTSLPVAILGSGFSDVAQAFINRVEQPTYTVGKDTRAILVRGEDLSTHLSNEAVRSAIDSGAVLIIDQPTRHELGVAVDSICSTEDFMLSMDEEEHDYHVCYDLVALDQNENIYVLNDIFDEDNDTTTYVLTPYLSGLHADPLAAWLNEYYSDSKASSSRAPRRSPSGDLSSLLSAQNITKTYTLKPNGDRSWKLSGRQCIYTVSTNIWVVYKFKEDADYYLIEQTIWGNNQNFWIGSWDQGNWSYQGFYLKDVYVDNKLWVNNRALSQSEGAYLLDFSPTTTNGQTSVTTTTGWNFGGQVGGEYGTSNKGGSLSLSGGISGSVGTTYSTLDLTITAKSGNDNSCNNNACWSFDIKTDNYKKSVWGYYSFTTPPQLGRETYKSSQCWQWKVEHPKTNGNFQLYSYVKFEYARDGYKNKNKHRKSTATSCVNENTEYITLCPPYRGEKK